MAELFETINILSLVLFFVGMALLAVELFVPGFGIFGALGFVALILCIVFQAKTFMQGLILFAIIAVIVTAFILIMTRSFSKGRLYKSALVLKNRASKEEGYVSNSDNSSLIGISGTALSPLRPSGRAQFDSKVYDVVSDGEFIEAGETITVLESAGRRILVKKENNNDEILSGL